MLKTFETRLRVSPEQATALEAFFTLWNRAARIAWARPRTTPTEIARVRATLRQMGLTSNQADSVLADVQARHKALRELKKTELAGARRAREARTEALRDKERTLKSLEKRLAAALRKAEALKPSEGQPRTRARAEALATTRRLRREIEQTRFWIAKKRQALERKEQQIARLNAALDADRFSMCFGSKALLAQHPKRSPETTPFKSVADWQQAWDDARRGHVYAVGRAREPSGNREVHWDPSSRTLRLRLPAGLEQTHLVFTDVDFAGHDGRARAALEHACEHLPVTAKLVRRRLTHADPVGGTARSEVAWYLQLSCEVTDAPPVGALEHGVLGIDLNAAGIAWAVVQPDGNRTEAGFEAYRLDGSTEARRTRVSQALERLLERAARECLAVAAERLDFGRVKAAFKAAGTTDRGERRFRRILSQLPTSQVRQLLESKCARLGLPLYLVNPAFSSVGGWSKYGRVNGDGIDEAAAHWIARQALYGSVYKQEGQALLVKKHNERLRLSRVPQPPKQSKKRVVRVSWQSVARALGRKRSQWQQRLGEYVSDFEVGPDPRGSWPPRQSSGQVRTGVMVASVCTPAGRRVDERSPATAVAAAG